MAVLFSDVDKIEIAGIGEITKITRTSDGAVLWEGDTSAKGGYWKWKNNSSQDVTFNYNSSSDSWEESQGSITKDRTNKKYVFYYRGMFQTFTGEAAFGSTTISVSNGNTATYYSS